jgi:hypothetical protein
LQSGAAGIVQRRRSDGSLMGGRIADLHFLRLEVLVVFRGSGEQEGVGDSGLAVIDFCDYVGAAQPVRLGEIGGRPLRGMVRMRMVEAGDLEVAAPRQTRYFNQLGGGDLVAAVGGIEANVGCMCERNNLPALRRGAAQQSAAALVRIGSLAVSAKFAKQDSWNYKCVHVQQVGESLEG